MRKIIYYVFPLFVKYLRVGHWGALISQTRNILNVREDKGRPPEPSERERHKLILSIPHCGHLQIISIKVEEINK